MCVCVCVIKKVKFELQHNNYVQSTGSIWRRPGCIPMGGGFPPNRQISTASGRFISTEASSETWASFALVILDLSTGKHSGGNVTLCQFRDNILMATSFLDHPTIGRSLRVLCPCDDMCRATCLSTSTVAMGYSLVMSAEGSATAYIQPSSLTPHWELKLGPPLVSPRSAHPKYLHGIFTGVLSNSQPWAKSHLAQLLSVAAWCQVAVLSGYSQRDTRRAMHSAIVRSYATSDHDYTRTVAYMHQVVLRVPQPRCCHLHQALQCVKRHGVWAHHSYASWRLPHHVSVDGAIAD